MFSRDAERDEALGEDERDARTASGDAARAGATRRVGLYRIRCVNDVRACVRSREYVFCSDDDE